jgi:hypothetical protein
MIGLLIDILAFVLFFKRKTPVGFVIAVTAVVLIILIATVIRQADYVAWAGAFSNFT